MPPLTPTAPTGPTDPDWDPDTERQLAELGWLPLTLCRITMLTTPMAVFSALTDTGVRIPLTLFILPALGALVVSPRSAILRMQVAISAMVFLVWLCLSYLWSVVPSETLFHLREQVPPLIGLVIVAGLLPVDETIRWFVRGVKLMALVSILALVIDDATRTSLIDGEIESGWRSWFLSKNSFGRAAVVSLMTFVVLDKTKVSRWVAIATALVFVVFSSSAAAIAATLVFFGLYWWVQRYRSVGHDWSGTFVVTSIFMGICGIIGAIVTAELIVGALGRDLSFTGRTGIWRASLDFVEMEPLLGYGYRAIFSPASEESRIIWNQIGFKAANGHSGPLDLALAAGIPGLALFYAMFLSTFSLALRHLRHHAIATFMFAFLIVQLLVSIAEPVYTNDWLAPVILGQTLLLKVGADRRRWSAQRDTWADELMDSIDLDATVDAEVVASGAPSG